MAGARGRNGSTGRAKRAIRARARAGRGELGHAERTHKSLAIEKAVASTDEYKRAGTVLLYASTADEVQTFGLIDRAIADGKLVLLPRMTAAETLVLHRITGTSGLRRNRYGILEPQVRAERVPKSRIELAIVPGVAFDERCYRLGLGKGCYDKLLPTLKNVVTVGLAFETQLVEEVPREAHDRPVDMIVTERRIIRKSEG